MVLIQRDGASFQVDVQVVAVDLANVSITKLTGADAPLIVTKGAVVTDGPLRTLAQNVIGEVNRAIASVRPSLGAELSAITDAIHRELMV